MQHAAGSTQPASRLAGSRPTSRPQRAPSLVPLRAPHAQLPPTTTGGGRFGLGEISSAVALSESDSHTHTRGPRLSPPHLDFTTVAPYASAATDDCAVAVAPHAGAGGNQLVDWNNHNPKEGDVLSSQVLGPTGSEHDWPEEEAERLPVNAEGIPGREQRREELLKTPYRWEYSEAGVCDATAGYAGGVC